MTPLPTTSTNLNGRVLAALALAAWATAIPSSARAQDQAAPPTPSVFTGSAGAGLSLTQGNSDTLNLSATFDAKYDPKRGNVMKGTLLFLRGKQNDILSVNRTSATFRDEDTVSRRAFVFAQIDSLHDTFKNIDYLIAPTAGIGYKAIDTMRTQYALDVGAGGAFERDTGMDAHVNGAITASEKLTHQLTPTTTLKHGSTALWKANHYAEALYTFSAGVAAKISDRFQLAVDVLDTFKNRPPDPSIKQNDVAVVTGLTAKF